MNLSRCTQCQADGAAAEQVDAKPFETLRTPCKQVFPVTVRCLHSCCTRVAFVMESVCVRREGRSGRRGMSIADLHRSDPSCGRGRSRGQTWTPALRWVEREREREARPASTQSSDSTAGTASQEPPTPASVIPRFSRCSHGERRANSAKIRVHRQKGQLATQRAFLVSLDSGATKRALHRSAECGAAQRLLQFRGISQPTAQRKSPARQPRPSNKEFAAAAIRARPL